jgi:AcrR family transcriptional regulator
MSDPKRPAKRKPPRRLRKQGEQTRRAILNAAMELYAETGFRGTGLMAIGERAGVHHATVLYHFGSSRDLLLAVLQERDRLFLEFGRQGYGQGGLAALRSLPLVARFNEAHPLWAKLFTILQIENVDEDAEAHDYFLERRRGARRLALTTLRDAKKRGEIRRDVDEQQTANTILAFAAGAQSQHLLDPKQVDLGAIFEHFTAMLVRDLTRGDATPRRRASSRLSRRSDGSNRSA